MRKPISQNRYIIYVPYVFPEIAAIGDLKEMRSDLI